MTTFEKLLDRDYRGSINDRIADFEMNDFVSLGEKVKRVALTILKVIILPWGLYELTKYTIQRLIMIPLYPLQSRILKLFIPNWSDKALEVYRLMTVRYLREGNDADAGVVKDFVVRSVVLKRNGVLYDGIAIGKPETIDNGKWIIQATGNGEPWEHTATYFAENYAKDGFNTLMVNGPACGRSQGHATPESMGDVQDLAITFAEEVLGATKIGMAGRSLGGAAMGRAVMKHTFKEDVDYFALFQMTFDRSSNIASKMVKKVLKGSTLMNWVGEKRIGSFVKWLIKWSGCEMDNVEAARKLGELGIRTIVAQSTLDGVPVEPTSKDHIGGDGVIPARASLAYRLLKGVALGNTTFQGCELAGHMDIPRLYTS